MINVTVSLKEEVAQWARLAAAGRNTSVSKLVGEMLEEHMRQEEGYQTAMQRFLSKEPVLLNQDGSYPSRNEVHERSLFR